VKFAGFVAGYHDGLAADPRRVVIVVIGNLAFMREIDPIALEDVLHLEIEQIGVREDIAAATEYTVLPVVLDGGMKQFIQLRGFVDNDGHVSSPYTCSRQWSTRFGVERILAED
jgi:hypothetical protein